MSQTFETLTFTQKIKQVAHFFAIQIILQIFTSIYGYSTRDITSCEVNNIVKKAFRMWEEIGDLRFEKTKYPMSADITISFLSRELFISIKTIFFS